jgi:hypothetical protein
MGRLTNYSISGSKIIKKLLIFFATFVAGYTAAQCLFWADLNLRPSEPQIKGLNRQVERPSRRWVEKNESGPVTFEYLFTDDFVDFSWAVFLVTNHGSQTVRFSDGTRDSSYFCRLHEGVFPGAFRVGTVPCTDNNDDVLEPGRFTYFGVRVDPKDLAYLLSVTYFVGPENAELHAMVPVEKPNRNKYGGPK